MWQNQQLLPFSINPVSLCPNGAGGGVCGPGALPPGASTSLSSLPAQSLNGEINTLLVNNVVTTQITPDLKTKFAYRYYDYHNQTPQLTFADWMITDAASAKATTINYAPVNPLNTAYIRQNGVAEATWRPVHSANLGVAYNFERYDFTRFDANSTAENIAKVYADWKPALWATVRAIFQWPVPRVSATVPTGFPNTTNYSPFYRQFYLDDRDRATATFQVDIDVIKGLTVSSTVIWRDDEYLLQQNQLGLTFDRSTAAGVEAAYSVSVKVMQ